MPVLIGYKITSKHAVHMKVNGISYIECGKDLFTYSTCHHLCTWMHNNVQNKYNHYAVKFDGTQVSHCQISKIIPSFCTKIIMVQYVPK